MSQQARPLLGKYRHYKGQDYQLLHIARHSETDQLFAVYQPLYGDSGVWIRPLEMFMESVTVEGKLVPRFCYMKEEPSPL